MLLNLVLEMIVLVKMLHKHIRLRLLLTLIRLLLYLLELRLLLVILRRSCLLGVVIGAIVPFTKVAIIHGTLKSIYRKLT